MKVAISPRPCEKSRPCPAVRSTSNGKYASVSGRLEKLAKNIITQHIMVVFVSEDVKLHYVLR